MDDQYRMIEQNIDALLDDNDVLVPTNQEVVTMKPPSFLSYKCLETAAKEGPIIGQYMKWSTVESDELNIQHHSVDQRVLTPPQPPVLPAYNLMVQSILFNFWNNNLRPNVPKRSCSFCKRNGMNYATYTSHTLRVNGILQCPYLIKCQCTYCFKNGHTMSYCPMKLRATVAGHSHRHNY